LSDVTIRRARSDEAATLSPLQEPSREAIALAGSAEYANRFVCALLERALAVDVPVFVAEREGRPVGFAQLGEPDDSIFALAKMSLAAVGVVGTIRGAYGMLFRRPVEHRAPPGGLHLFELQVSPAERGHGVGGTLLDRIDEYAVEHAAPHISLTTASGNPARRLYERHGYDVVAEKRSARYERFAGQPGRVLMVKTLPA
jgi:ribosomal protein S18 acetylase RimI-like enzyme